MALLDRFIAATIGWVPRPLVRRIAARYVAGETWEQAVAVARRLNEEGCSVTFDHLGEFVTDPRQADAATSDYLGILERIRKESLIANVSIKLTAFGLVLGEEATLARVREVVRRARELGNFVRIDMEDSSCTDATLRIYRRLREEDLGNVGIVLQAYLRRTLGDIRALGDIRPSYRLCKGIYVEPPAIAITDAEAIRENFLDALRAMFSGGSRVGIATHDEALIRGAKSQIKELSLTGESYEFQMLLGVADDLRRALVAEGHPLRVYVPYGADWYGYCVRRLKESPRIGRHVLLALVGQRSRSET